MKNNCVKTSNVYWNDTELTEQQIQENNDRIINLDISSIIHGYDCSSCDPFLLLVSQIYRIDIKHNYNGHIISYKYKNPNKDDCNKMLYFISDKGHFWCSG
jgi:hypothetical protein